jgi:signal peptidase I
MKKKYLNASIRLTFTLILSAISIHFILTPVSKLQAETSFLTIEWMIAIIIFSMGAFILLFLPKTLYHTISEWIGFFILSFLSIMFVFSFFILPSNVNQSSMFPTLSSGDRILIYHYQYEVKKDDIAVIEIRSNIYSNIPAASFIDPQTNQPKDFVYYVKRVYGIPGDTLTFERVSFLSENFYIYLNGEKLYSISNVAYTLTQAQKSEIETQLVENRIETGYFVLGDNAPSSLDSRAFGLVRDIDMKGKVIYKLWPFGGIS